MRRLLPLVVVLAGLMAAAACGGAGEAGPAADAGLVPAAQRGPGLMTGTAESIEGPRVPLGGFRGGPVLVVNTASQCGFTPQFEGLQALYEARRGDGLTVVGFPSDDFRQELGANGEIAEFCRVRYGVSFPLMAESAVTGPHATPLFRAIAARLGPAGREPSWNFTKYLLDARGRLAARFDPSVEPDDPRVTAAIDGLRAEGTL